MVYESDFYTIRRPYSTRVTPSVSSYSVSQYPADLTDKYQVILKEVPFVPTPVKSLYGMSICKWRARNAIPFGLTPRHYSVVDSPYAPRRAEENYSYSYTSNTESSSRANDPYSPSRNNRSYSTTERVNRTSGGPGGYNYTTTSESSRRSGDGPGGYHASYSSTASGNLPGGTRYRHFSYHV
ncbi:protein anoxia up-regulated isoform X8 [Chrysoperla carnea]|uniref:protein anoxia up-regulated isoform X8 n=1 Tax=Chrysoperla carnea TaxID=189513 RepID=UPI001D07A226|nr:protein anoxia up-regulated isoform X8 [Chrysoperla carnea]